jgi:predicted Zn-ribbon and HTH transcriptional regulator
MSITSFSMVVKRCTCERCGKVWIPRFERVPIKCIGCKSQYWNRARTRGVPRKRRKQAKEVTR